jgi:hypothetical protein
MMLLWVFKKGRGLSVNAHGVAVIIAASIDASAAVIVYYVLLNTLLECMP